MSKKKTKEEEKQKDKVANKPKEENKIDFKQQLADLIKKSLEKETIIHQKEEVINNLKKQIETINEEYKKQISSKMNEANNLLAQKNKELEAKYHDAMTNAKKYAIKDQALNLINIVNQFEIACNYKLQDEKLINYQKGFKIFLTMFNNLLKDLNITMIQPKINEEFEPSKMECLETTNDPAYGNNVITQVINGGYMLYDIVLKPALVKVNKK